MFLYYLWPSAEKVLSYLPLGSRIYKTAGLLLRRNSVGRSDNSSLGIRLAKKAKELVPSGGTVMDVGTGWIHLDAFLLWLVGDYRVYLFDVVDKARLRYIRTYLNNLVSQIDLVSEELGIDRDVALDKLSQLLRVETRESIYEACNFVPCITNKTDTPFLPDNSVDFMVSTCVLNHIPPKILLPKLAALRQILKPEGRMYHMLGHEDHWTFHDRSAYQFNYYRYSDRYYRLIFDTKFEFQNRFVKQEWLEILEKCGLEVEEYHDVITDHSREQICRLSHIDSRFARYPKEELAITHSYVLLRRSTGSAASVLGTVAATPPKNRQSPRLPDRGCQT